MEQKTTDMPSELHLKMDLHMINDHIRCEPRQGANETRTIQCDETFLLEIIRVFGTVIEVSEKRIVDVVVLEEKLVDFDPEAFDWQMTDTGLVRQYNQTQKLQMAFIVKDKLDTKKNEKVKNKKACRD